MGLGPIDRWESNGASGEGNGDGQRVFHSAAGEADRRGGALAEQSPGARAAGGSGGAPSAGGPAAAQRGAGGTS